MTGPGGSGKTRLAIEAASEAVDQFRHGVFWIGLATVRDAQLVVPSIAQAIGAHEELPAHIGEKETLLLLDNLEQVVEVAPEIAALLESCPNLRLLVTSRELLRVRGEVEYEVPPLAAQDAVELFCARSRLSPSPAIGDLCRRLDDMPLALELAAARTKALTPEQIIERLGKRLDLFQGGRDADPRQATLRATLEWSHDLLSPQEQQAFRRLAVFAGGCTFEVAEDVANAELETLQSLVEKSLVRRTEERFWMLETIREYAAERLAESGESDVVRRRHAECFAGLLERVEERLAAAPFTRDDIVTNLPNLRAAVDFARADEDDVLELTLLGLTRPLMRDSLPSYRSRLENLLRRASAAPARTRVRAIGNLAFATYRGGDYDAALRFAEKEFAAASDLDDQRLVALALNNIASAKLAMQEARAAREALEKAATLLAEAGDERAAGVTKVNLADVLLAEGEYTRAKRLCDEAAPIFARLEDPDSRLSALTNGATASVLAETPDAPVRVLEILSEVRPLDDEYMVALALQLAAAIAARRADLEQAADFLAGADGLRAAVGAALEPTEERVRQIVLSRLGPEPQTPEHVDAAALKERASLYLANTASQPALTSSAQ